jgi:hypothetical protein
MRLIALAFGINKSGREIIESIAKNIFKRDIEIIDVKTTEVILQPTDRVLCFGRRALKETNGDTWVCFLPDLRKLEPGNDEQRSKTYKQLLETKQTIDNEQIITEKDLPRLSCEKVQAIENRLKEKNQTSWKGKTKDGRSVELQIESVESSADIVLTFAEMYAIRTAMDTLDIEELIIS